MNKNTILIQNEKEIPNNTNKTSIFIRNFFF